MGDGRWAMGDGRVPSWFRLALAKMACYGAPL